MKKYFNMEKLVNHLVQHINEIEGQEAVIRLLYDYFKGLKPMTDGVYAIASLGFSYEEIVSCIEEEAENLKNAKVGEVE